MHDGIQYWAMDGSAGWLLDIVLLLLPAQAGPGRRHRDDAGRVEDLAQACGSAITSNSTSSSSSPSFSPSSAGLSASPSSTLPGPSPLRESRLLPDLPPFMYGATDVLPADTATTRMDDVPVQIYRRQRLLRALGLLPPQRVLLPGRTTPATPTISQLRRPGHYRGELAVVAWNAQAFFAADPGRRETKERYLRSLLVRGDAVLISEAHGCAGQHKAYEAPRGCSSWWSAGPSAAHAGIGIVVKNSFLEHFEEISWQVLWPGRAGRLRLRGREGALDLIACYFHSGATVMEADLYGDPDAQRTSCSSFPVLRALLRDRLARHVANASQVLSILGGDFNWVTDAADRRTRSGATASGNRDAREERHFQAVLGRPFGLQEMHQAEMTFASTRARSRLDRVYCNQHVAEQLDRNIRAIALEWKPQVSDHRAVLFSRRLPQRPPADARPLTDAQVRHPDFARQVRLEYHQKVAECPGASSLQRLQMLKDSMRFVATHCIPPVGRMPEAVDLEDRLGVTMKFLRAAEAGAMGCIS